MKVNLHCRNFDQGVKDAIYGMVGYGLAKLLPDRERLLNNVEIIYDLLWEILVRERHVPRNHINPCTKTSWATRCY